MPHLVPVVPKFGTISISNIKNINFSITANSAILTAIIILSVFLYTKTCTVSYKLSVKEKAETLVKTFLLFYFRLLIHFAFARVGKL